MCECRCACGCAQGYADQRQAVDEDEVDDADDEAGEVADQRQHDQRLPAEFVGQG